MGRGPSYPYVDLEQAIGLTRKMYDYTKRAPAPLDSVVKEAWNYSAASSSGQKVLAALKAYGLIEDAPGANGKAIKLTQRSIRILLDEPNSAERNAEIRRAALSPKWYEFCWKTWGSEMPTSMRSNLLIEHGFIDSTIGGFLKDYKKTIAFASLTSNDQQEEGSESSSRDFKIGDYVQWESSGTLRMPAARRLTGYSPDGDFAFVEGSSTGIPLSELIAGAPADEESEVRPDVQPQRSTAGQMRRDAAILQEVFSLPDGTAVSIQWPKSFTADAFEDFSDWLDLVKRKVQRTVARADSALVPSAEEKGGN